ncbi:MAG: alpha/beta fold hydrolase [Pseudomonadota bacterium]
MRSNLQPDQWSVENNREFAHAKTERCGPRPLGLHIAHAEWAWRSVNPAQLNAFYRGVKAYRTHPYRRSIVQRPKIWKKGNCQLIDYGPVHGWPLLVVPSLINRAYILDLMPGVSLLEFLRDGGIRPLLFDWGESSGANRQLGLSQLMQDYMEPALRYIRRDTGRRPLVLGYCMGGTLTTALACLCHDQMAGLALLAPPWDFSRDHHSTDQAGRCHVALASGAGCIGSLPVDFQQMLFAQIDPLAVPRKFARFTKTELGSDAAHRFVAIEDWLNDGVSMSAEVATECLVDWYGNNMPARGTWRISGIPIRPERLHLPTFLAIPDHDRIVPPHSAEALGRILRNHELVKPRTGHIGMITGKNAKNVLWDPLLRWLERIAAMQKNLGKTPGTSLS